MLRTSTPSKLTQVVVVAGACGISSAHYSPHKFHDPPCKSVNKRRKSLSDKELYLQTAEWKQVRKDELMRLPHFARNDKVVMSETHYRSVNKRHKSLVSNELYLQTPDSIRGRVRNSTCWQYWVRLEGYEKLACAKSMWLRAEKFRSRNSFSKWLRESSQ